MCSPPLQLNHSSVQTPAAVNIVEFSGIKAHVFLRRMTHFFRSAVVVLCLSQVKIGKRQGEYEKLRGGGCLPGVETEILQLLRVWVCVNDITALSSLRFV